MNDAHIAAIISAVSGISGVILGNSFVAIKESLKDRKKDKRDLNYLAILVVSHLDRFVSGCWSIAMDDGTSEGRPAGRDGSRQTTVTPPEFLPLEIKVEWRVLPKDLMYEILEIPDRRERLESHLSGIAEFEGPPDYTDFFWTRMHDYAELGLHVSAVAKRLRKHAGLPIEEPAEDEWNRETDFQKVIDKIDAWRAEQEKRNLAMFAAMNKISQQ